MSIYSLPKFEFSLKPKKTGANGDTYKSILFIAVIVSLVFGFLGGFTGYYLLSGNLDRVNVSNFSNESGTSKYQAQTNEEAKTIQSIKDVSPAVVSIIISKDVPVFEQYMQQFQQIDPFFGPFQFQIPQQRQKGTEKQEVGGGTGFIVTSDGIILTNKHVVSDDTAEYTVYTNTGKKYPAKVLALDPVQDLAVIKIEPESGATFPTVKLGNSDEIQLGQSVIAIGNALGEFRNTVSSGVVSGLSRTINASGGSTSETLEDVIQIDAAINPGNSGGPLINLNGEVIGINTAMVQQAQSIGFTIPINKAKRDITQVKASGKISYPFLGVRYILITKDSAADKAGLKEGDIITEINGEKITQDNSLSEIISKYSPGDKVTLKYLRDNKEATVETTLGERNE
ncbi:MAG: trypsin-like peptidase domain-containing protein [Candidatus Nealsonbacteria bacterium]|nr:trypsin-like peptidase domain-containing protein [Candidatus Nealsonbacteria bacterium]